MLLQKGTPRYQKGNIRQSRQGYIEKNGQLCTGF
jgi:hypothetical protein